MPEKKKTPSSPSGDEAPGKQLKRSHVDDVKAHRDEATATPDAKAPPSPRSIPDANLIAEVQSLLLGADPTCLTWGELRRRLEDNLGLPGGALASRKRMRRRVQSLVHEEVVKKSQRSAECEKIMKEVVQLPSPLPVRRMLIDSLQHCLPRPGAELHPHQVQLLSIVQDALTEESEAIRRRQKEAQDQLQVAEADFKEKERCAQEAQSLATAADDRVQQAKAAAQDTENERLDMLKELSCCSQQTAAVFQESSQIVERWNSIQAIQKHLTSLAEGLWTCEEEWWECFAVLQQHMLDTGAEGSLLTATTVSLKKRPNERSAFDAMAVDGVRDFLQGQRETVEVEKSRRPQVEMQAEATLSGWESLVNAAQHRAAQQAQALRGAESAQEKERLSLALAAAAVLPCCQRFQERRQQKAALDARLASLSEALQLITSSMCPAQPEAETKVQDDCKMIASSSLDVHSPLRVPTPLKGRLSY